MRSGVGCLWKFRASKSGLKVHSWRPGRTVRWGQAGAGVAGSSQNIPAYYLPRCPSELRLLARGGKEGGPGSAAPRGPRRSAPGKDPLSLHAGTPGPRLVSVAQPPPAALLPRSAGSQVTRTKPGPQSRNNQAPEPDSCPSALPAHPHASVGRDRSSPTVISETPPQPPCTQHKCPTASTKPTCLQEGPQLKAGGPGPSSASPSLANARVLSP